MVMAGGPAASRSTTLERYRYPKPKVHYVIIHYVRCQWCRMVEWWMVVVVVDRTVDDMEPA